MKTPDKREKTVLQVLAGRFFYTLSMNPSLSPMREKLSDLGERRVLHQLFELLRLPYVDWHSGYWDLCLAGELEVKKYCRIYAQKSLNDEQKFAAMSLIVASYGKLLAVKSGKQAYEAALWALISELLQNDRHIHNPIVEHWCNFNDADLMEGALYFHRFDVEQVSKLMRAIHSS